MLTYDDVLRLRKALEGEHYGFLSVDVAGTRVEIERVPATVTTAARETPTTAIETETATAETYRTRAPAAGAIAWCRKPAELLGTAVAPATVIAHLDSGEHTRPVVAGCAGVINYCAAIEDGAFVEYGQWLLSIGS